MRLLLYGMLLLCLFSFYSGVAQDSSNRAAPLSDRVLDFPGKLFNKLRTNTDQMQQRLVSQSQKYVRQMAKREARVKAKLYKIDSAKAIALFSASDAKYQSYLSNLQSGAPPSNSGATQQYLSSLDSLHTSLSFLQNNPSLLSSAKDVASLDQSLASVQQLQARFNQTGDIQQYVAQREQLLKSQLGSYGFGKELNGLNSQAYYYQQQLQQYKELLHDKAKLKQKAIDELTKLPAYQAFMQKNSMIAKLFGLPEGYESGSAITSLQTKGMVQQMISQLGGGNASANGSAGASSGGTGSAQFEQQQLNGAQASLGQLQNKVTQLALPSSTQGSLTMPDFQPNTQKTKTFLQRLEYGLQIQTQKSSIQLPTTANIGLKVGYKFSEKATAGIGASYILGLGNGLNHFGLSNQGVGLQSYFDIKAKSSIWITGGLEYNYFQAFSKFSQLKSINAWQQSGLIGIEKKYKLSPKRQGNLQLLYDLLYRQHTPFSQPILFRTGINF